MSLLRSAQKNDLPHSFPLVFLMTPPLSPVTERLVYQLFRPAEREQGTLFLEEECGNRLPFCKEYDEFEMERIRFAALKLAEGDLKKLREAIELAKVDWRDVLVAAGFGEDVHLHKRWAQETLSGPSSAER